MYVIVAYDIALDKEGVKVQSRLRKVCKQYLFHFQYSLFIGELSIKLINELKAKIFLIVRPLIDECSVFEITTNSAIKKENIGKAPFKRGNNII